MSTLVNTVTSKVRFSEVDSMQIVWHGNYVKFLEDGREQFGKEFGLGYFDVYNQGYMVPIVKVDMNYKRSIKYGETVRIETTFVHVDAAKIIFDYKIFRSSDDKLSMSARTVQAFLDTEGDLQLTNPPFFTEWKKKHKIID